MESLFVEYEIEVDGKKWPYSWFADDEEHIRKNTAERLNIKPENVKVRRID